jgi:hypothetical protein
VERGEHEPACPLVLALSAALGVECTAFKPDGTEPPAEKRKVGRPRKAAPAVQGEAQLATGGQVAPAGPDAAEGEAEGKKDKQKGG